MAPARDASASVGALDELHHERGCAAGFFEAMDLRDVRMVERARSLGFALKPGEPLRIGGERFGQDLDRDVRDSASCRGRDRPRPFRPRRCAPAPDTRRVLAFLRPRDVRSVVDLDHGGRLQKALRALVRRQERLHFLAQRLVAGAGHGEVGLTVGRRQRPCARKHLFQALQIIRRECHVL